MKQWWQKVYQHADGTQFVTTVKFPERKDALYLPLAPSNVRCIGLIKVIPK